MTPNDYELTGPTASEQMRGDVKDGHSWELKDGGCWVRVERAVRHETCDELSALVWARALNLTIRVRGRLCKIGNHEEN